MFNYFHIYPTCPHCLEPNFKGIHLLKSHIDDFCENCKECKQEECEWNIYKDRLADLNELYHCVSCNAIFNKYIDLSEFKETIEYVDGLKDNGKIPLIWNIELNDIEKDYIDWIDEIEGKYLITWPFDEVNFIPIFITEYISKYPNNKVVIIDDFPDAISENEIMKPSSLEIFESLLYSHSKITLNKDEIKDYQNFSYKNIFRKINRFHHTTSFKYHKDQFKSPIEQSYGIYTGKTIYNYNKIIVDDLNNEYGNGCIRENIVDGKRRKIYCNENGFIDLKVDKRSSWTQTKKKFKNTEYWEAIININNFNRAKDDFKYISIKSEEDFDFDDNHQIYFISKNLPNLFDIVNQINPNLVLFPNADEFMIHYSVIYHSELGRSFKNFIENSFSDCLLFSTNKEARHLYTKKDFIINYGISLHTWDADLVLSQINTEEHYTKTAGSSSFESIKPPSKIECSYLEIDELNRFEEYISKLNEVVKDRTYNEYLSKLLRSPLLAFSKKSYLEFKLPFNDTNLASILTELNRTYPDLSNELRSIYQEIYSNERNPVFVFFLNVVEKQLNNNKNVLIVLFNRNEARTFKKLLTYKNVELPDSVEILYWSELNDIGELKNNSVVISTSYPQISYKLYTSKLKKFIFIGSKNYLEKIKTIVGNRVDTTNCRPLYYDNSINYPKLLKNILESLEIINDIKKVPIYFFDDEIEFEDDDEDMGMEPTKKSKAKIETGETALLLLDNHNNGLFIPKKYGVMYKHPKNIVAVDFINEKNFSKLKNKTIVLNRNNFMISFKDIFYKFIVNEGDGIEIISETYRWNNFYELINSVFDWRNELNNCLNIMRKENPFADNLATLAKELKNSNTVASHDDYIKKFWLSDDSSYCLKTKHGILNIYDIEKPFGHYKDLIEIFTVIQKHNDKIDVQEKALKNYAAYKYFRKIRNSFLNHRRIDPKFNHLYVKFDSELEQMIRRQELFKVVNIEKVKLTGTVTPFKKITNFKEYYD